MVLYVSYSRGSQELAGNADFIHPFDSALMDTREKVEVLFNVSVLSISPEGKNRLYHTGFNSVIGAKVFMPPLDLLSSRINLFLQLPHYASLET
jgi:hypothetical protein